MVEGKTMAEEISGIIVPVGDWKIVQVKVSRLIPTRHHDVIFVDLLFRLEVVEVDSVGLAGDDVDCNWVSCQSNGGRHGTTYLHSSSNMDSGSSTRHSVHRECSGTWLEGPANSNQEVL